MNLSELQQSNLVIFRITAGSIAYGLNTPTSDVDERGIFVLPVAKRLEIMDADQQIANESQDIVYYDIHKYFKLAIDCNPNIIEFLWTPKDCIHFMDKEGRMQHILANRDLFISAKAYHTFSGYAYAQIKKCRGQNKLVHNPKPKEPPKKEDFCWVIAQSAMKSDKVLPCRPVAHADNGIVLQACHAAQLEHVPNTYRLYYYGPEAKGVFRGDDMLVCESIPLEDEIPKFVGLLIYNQHEYEKALRDWKNYWDWVNNRNDARWEHQEAGKIDYDAKNMMHCLRLLFSGKNILQTGEPIVRFEGEQKDYLMQVRSGIFKYEDIMTRVDKEMAELEVLKTTTKLPWGANVSRVNMLYYDIVRWLE